MLLLLCLSCSDRCSATLITISSNIWVPYIGQDQDKTNFIIDKSPISSFWRFISYYLISAWNSVHNIVSPSTYFMADKKWYETHQRHNFTNVKRFQRFFRFFLIVGMLIIVACICGRPMTIWKTNFLKRFFCFSASPNLDAGMDWLRWFSASSIA